MSGDRIFGFHPVREALRRRPDLVREVLISEARTGKRADEIESLCEERDVPARRLPATEVDRLVGGVHNGFVAEVEGRGGTPSTGDPGLVVLLEDVQDPRNLGALLRVCDGAGVGRVLVRDRGSAPVSAVAVKASAGAAEWVPVERVTNAAATLERLKGDGFWTYGADAAGDPVWEVDLTGKVVLCLGGEGSGLRRRTRETCDGLVSLPMLGRVESLNVATAAAALLYEIVRQRRA